MWDSGFSRDRGSLSGYVEYDILNAVGIAVLLPFFGLLGFPVRRQKQKQKDDAERRRKWTRKKNRRNIFLARHSA